MASAGKKPYSHNTTTITFLVFFVLCLMPYGVALGQEITPPVAVATSGVDGTTLAIPRWKGFMSETDPNDFWLSYAQGGSSDENVKFTTNAGQTWSSNTFQVGDDGFLDMHTSLFGRGSDLYFTWPGGFNIHMRKINSPAQGNSDRGPLRTVPGGSGEHRSNITVDGNGRVWVFTRISGDPGENVLYHYSDDAGATWTNGVAFSTNCQNVRIGSMPYVGGNATLVVYYMNDPRGYEYYRWNGSAFVARSDRSIYPGDMGEARVFTHNVVNDTTFHLIFGLGNNLRHVWKHNWGGQGSWTSRVIDTSPNTYDNDWFTVSTVQGGKLYLFYTRKSSADFSTSRVYMKIWDQASQTWTAPTLVSASLGYNRDPNTCFKVPVNSDYIPVFWNSGAGSTRTIYFSKILVDGQPEIDTIPPATINDLGSVMGKEQGTMQLSWTAPGDDGDAGFVERYEIAYWVEPITEENWDSAIIAPESPLPLPGNTLQEFTLSGLEPGALYHTAIRSYDDAGNISSVSNSVECIARGIMPPIVYWSQ
jgi:hypothetical protein